LVISTYRKLLAEKERKFSSHFVGSFLLSIVKAWSFPYKTFLQMLLRFFILKLFAS